MAVHPGLLYQLQRKQRGFCNRPVFQTHSRKPVFRYLFAPAKRLSSTGALPPVGLAYYAVGKPIQKELGMSAYKKMLVAIDLTEEAPQVLEKAKIMSEAHGASLVLVHVVEPVGYAYGGDIPMDLTELQTQLDKAAREQLAAYGAQYGVDKTNQIVTVGRPESEIHRLVKEQAADLVIVGSHGRKGFQLLLGSTANGVLHGTECDVLAIRIR